MATRVVPDRNGMVSIGKIKTNLVTEVALPIGGLGDGSGSYTVLFRRPKEDSPYPVESRVEGGNLIWSVTAADTAIAGTGKAECRWDGPGGEVGKSITYLVRITDGLADPTEAPESWAGYIGAVARDAGKGYRLKTDLTWEEYDLPPEPEAVELTTEEKAAAFDEIAGIYEEEGDNDT